VRFPQAFIDEVRHAADIVAVVQDYVSLRKAGSTYKGLCPFHAEKTPSFHVNQDKGFFHCFGCNTGGDVFKFVELQEKIGFTDTVRQLAQRFGVPIPQMEAGEGQAESTQEREALLRIHEVACGYFQEQLATPAGARIREYLRTKRGLTEATVATLKLGWAPPSRDGLRNRLREQGFRAEVVARSGLVVVRDDGTVIDRFRNRLMVPILRDTGSVVAFGGRALEADQQPKYLNSPETPIYAKSRTLYGLNYTKGALREKNFAVIVEGYFDFAQLYQAGGLPVVATCGTALTPQQCQLLRRFASKVIINFDPDSAGQSAAERSCELLVSEGFVVNVIRLPGGDDPDTFLQAHGRDAYLAQLKHSQPYLEFLLDRASAGRNLNRADDRREFLGQMLGVASRIPDPAVRDQFADRLAVKARITEGVVRDEIRKAAAARKTAVPAAAVRPRGAVATLRDAEKGLLWALVNEPGLARRALASLEPTDLEGLTSEEVLLAGLRTGDVAAEAVPAALLERLSEQDALLLSRVAAEPHAPQPDMGGYLDSCVEALRGLRLRRELGEIDAEFRAVMAGDADPGRLADLHARKITIKRLLRED
jgi:DNA primase